MQTRNPVALLALNSGGEVVNANPSTKRSLTLEKAYTDPPRHGDMKRRTFLAGVGLGFGPSLAGCLIDSDGSGRSDDGNGDDNHTDDGRGADEEPEWGVVLHGINRTDRSWTAAVQVTRVVHDEVVYDDEPTIPADDRIELFDFTAIDTGGESVETFLLRAELTDDDGETVTARREYETHSVSLDPEIYISDGPAVSIDWAVT